MLSVGRVIVNRVGNDSDRTANMLSYHHREIWHVADWLAAAVLEGAAWLDNKDEFGRPKKLMKYGSLDRISAEADKVMLRKARIVGKPAVTDADIEFIARLDGGFAIVRLLTPTALDAESAEMQHCVGHGSYDERLASTDTMFLSLRDRNGKPHATAEIRAGVVQQVSGKQNESPKFKYIVPLFGYFVSQGYDVAGYGTGSCGWVITVDGTVHANDRLPESISVPGNLDLTDRDRQIPQEIAAAGNVFVRIDHDQSAPRFIKAGGDICLSGAGFRELPAIESTGHLVLENTRIERLSPGLCLKGLSVIRTPLVGLPDDIKVNGELCLITTCVRSLPPSLWNWKEDKASSYGSVDISDSPVSSLGGLSHVRGNLRIVSTAMTELPEGIEVEKHLDIIGGSIQRIPTGTKVHGDFKISKATVSFPQGELNVGGCLSVSLSKVSMPKTARCKSFYAYASTIKMPRIMECEDSILLDETRINRFPNRIRGTMIQFRNLSSSSLFQRLRSLGGDLVAKSLLLQDAPLQIGAHVTVDSVVVEPPAGKSVLMTIKQARTYLGAHKSFGRRGGLSAYALSASLTVSSGLFFDPDVIRANGKRIVYDEFHRRAA
jgi:hypothetical protein